MQRIGLIGIGDIGKRLIDNLLDADYEIVGHDIDTSKKSYVTDLGGEWADTPADVAAETEAVVLAVPGAPEVRSIFEDEGGLLEELESDQLVIDTSTTGPDPAEVCADLCHERDAHFLTAPLTRGAAEDGIHIMAGGTEEDYEVATPLLDDLCHRHTRIGSAPDAQRFKLILQVRYACQDAVDAEVVAFARDQGLDPSVYRDFLGLDVNEKYITRDFSQVIEGLGGLAIWHKDLGYALDIAKEEDTATPITNAVYEAYKYGIQAAGENEGNDTAILKYWETLNQTDAQ